MMSRVLRNPKQQNFRQKNLQILRRRSSRMVDYLQNEQPTAEVKVVPTRSGAASLTCKRANKRVHLHSAYDPVAEAKAWCTHLDNDDWQIGIVFGMGMGYHVEELIRRYPDRSIVVVEPSADILNCMLQERDLRPLLEHPNFSIVASVDILAAAVALFEQHVRDEIANGKVAFFAWPAYRRIWPEFWQQLPKQVGKLAQQQFVNISTYNYFAQLWQENFFANVRSSVTDPSVKSLFSLFQGKPAILVASGPSLQKNIHLLKEAKDSALIVAAGSAIGPLLANGIMPHLVVSFDAAPANYYVFSNMDTQEMILVYSAVIYPRIVAEHKGPRFALGVDIYPYERWFFEKIGQDRGNIACGPSVANLTWDLIRQMGCDPIVFVGQDLAFGFEGRAHAEGRVDLDYELVKPDDNTVDDAETGDFLWVEDIWGNRVRTRPVWLAMKTWFEQRIYAWGKGRTFIDATEGGAKIVGTQILSLREVMDTYCQTSFDASAQILNVYRQQRTRLDTPNVQRKLDGVLHQIVNELEEVLGICADGKTVLRDLKLDTQNKTLSEAAYVAYFTSLRELDAKFSEREVYRQFMRPSLEHSIAAFGAMSARLRTETELLLKGEQLAMLYASLFASVQEMANQLLTYTRHTIEHSDPYAPAPLANELDYVSSVCTQIRVMAARLDELAHDPQIGDNWQEAQSLHAEIGKLAPLINQTEVMRLFVKEIVEQKGDDLKAIQELSARANQENDVTVKIACLAQYHLKTMDLVEAILKQVREYSRT